MKFTQIRNATAILEFAGKRFLIDPLFAPKETYPALPGTYNDHLNWPTVELPMSVDTILEGLDAAIVTHTHPDHWDEHAIRTIPKSLQIFAQNEMEAAQIRRAGFINVDVLEESTIVDGIKLSKTSGQHGNDEVMAAIGDMLGEVSGVVFSHPDEKTTYIAGDTVWNEHVDKAITQHKPEVLILNAGDAMSAFGSIIMGKQDVLKAHQARPDAMIIATHMEAVNLATLTRVELKQFVTENDLTDFVLIPEDGESCTL
ncbi:MBL fold metallo-hydrolase [Vibrio coralliilyticus]|uniref:MBL fold metallo-hydrolase n=1 Tax=Vibrio coralliilyticus TaxID=190893 RepID=UPI0015615590|nr:MBL fold metallo-hydrolase [Vibrio coralliilyticus]NRF24399.1 MBL fold metallo-hydrolase [Vibrio coralliilyticus]NRF78835.1 MBL fold metallo-hydrolase [Vibrio coralliilyticus]